MTLSGGVVAGNLLDLSFMPCTGRSSITVQELGFMDIYHIWFNLRGGVQDTEFAQDVHAYLDHLKELGSIAGYRLSRRKLGLGPPQLPIWHITLDFENMAQMDSAFSRVSSRTDPIESFHHAVNSKVQDIFFALYRDFPDRNRVTGQEKF